MTILVFGLISCNDSASGKNGSASPENIDFVVPEFQIPSFKGLSLKNTGNVSASKAITEDNIGNLTWAEIQEPLSFPLLTGFNHSPAQSEYEYEIFGEKLTLVLKNSRNERFWGYFGDNNWWNSDKYVFEGKSDSIYLKIEISKDLKHCSYIQAFEIFEEYVDFIHIVYSDNIVISADGSYCTGLLTNLDSVIYHFYADYNDGDERERKSVCATVADWYCDKDVNVLMFYDRNKGYMNLINKGEDRFNNYWWCLNLMLCNEADLDFVKTSADSENVKKHLDLLSQYEMFTELYPCPSIYVKDTITGKMKIDWTYDDEKVHFDVLQDYLKNTYSENWELQLQPETEDFEECVVNFWDIYGVFDFPKQYVKKFGKVKEPISINELLLNSEYTKYLLQEFECYELKDFSMEWRIMDQDGYIFDTTWDCDICKVRTTELNLVLFPKLHNVNKKFLTYWSSFDGNTIRRGEDIYLNSNFTFPPLPDGVKDGYWLAEWYDEWTELQTRKIVPETSEIWNIDVGNDGARIDFKPVRE